MLPSLSCLSLTTGMDAPGDHKAKRAKVPGSIQNSETNGSDVIVTETTHRLHRPQSEFYLNVGCVSAAEMIVAKVVLDCYLLTKGGGGNGSTNDAVPLHEQLQKSFLKSGLTDIRDGTIRLFKDAINGEVENVRTTTDILRWHQLRVA